MEYEKIFNKNPDNKVKYFHGLRDFLFINKVFLLIN